MSRWRQQGFVQDSDEEDLEEESQIESQGSRHARLDGRVERVENGTEKDNRHEALENEAHEHTEDERGEPATARTSLEAKEWERRPTTPTKSISPRRPTPSPFTPKFTHDVRREPTESPDPLQRSPTPKIQRITQLPSSQRLPSPIFQQSSSVSVAQLNENVAIPSQVAGRSNPPQPAISNNHASTILGEFGIAPLSDESGDESLSDPPSDLESPPIAMPAPHRRTVVQVVIPTSTALQREVAEYRFNREFRQRKPIQLHPYALEGERYRREVQSRGLKPVRRERSRSPQRQQRQQDGETQEQEFNPDDNPTSSPPEPEIPVSTPIFQRSRKDAHRPASIRRPTSDPARRLPSTQLSLPRPPKRRKLNFSSTQAVAAPRMISEDRTMPRDIWSVPPNSPPYSSSPPRNGNSSARRLNRLRVTTPAPNLLTPSTSSVIQDDPRLLIDSDSEPVPRSAHRSGGELRRPARVIITDSSSSAAESSSEPEKSDNELRQVSRKMKGVLPASWLRFDRQTQERRQAQQRERERARLNSALSPEPAEPLRGVAQRVTKPAGRPRRTSASNRPSRDLVVVSDDSEDELRAPVPHHAQNVQDSVDNASALASIFDNRYADDNLSDMEHDPLHLPTLGGTGPKRKRQTKITDAFSKPKKSKVFESSARVVGSGSRPHIGHASKKKHGVSKVPRRTPPPAMSVIDVDVSPSRRDGDVPQFLKIARRQALRRPDLARQSPKNKQIRLHNARDTEDANITLQQWRRGTLKPRANAASQQRNTRHPLANRIDDEQHARRQSSADANSAKDLDRQSETGTKVSRPRQRKTVPTGLHIFQRSSTQKAKPTQREKKVSRSDKVPARPAPRGSLPFRTAQLEGDENDFGRSHRKIAFEKGLLRVDQQFGMQLPEEQPFVNPQLARYLADDDAALPPLPSANETGEGERESPKGKAPPTKRRLVRKTQARRVDVDAREYRQPSEPAVQEILTTTVINEHQNVGPEQDLVVLHGLGPYGTQYPTTFDVQSLASGTYFHSSTFIGSDEFRRALSIGRPTGRDLDEQAGYCTVAHDTLSVRCGPWNDETSSRIHEMVRMVLAPWQVNDQRSNLEMTLAARDLISHSARLLRALMTYISDHLSFLDPIDRKDFVAKFVRITQELFDGIYAAHGTIGGQEPLSDESQSGTRAMTYALVLNTQLCHIAQHTTVGPSSQVEVINAMKSVSKIVVSHLIRHGVAQLSNFLEQNKRHAVRENGVQASDVDAECTVICMHVLNDIDMPSWGFWDLVGQVLCPNVVSAVHVSSFDTTWATLFIFLPFIEIDVSGIPLRSRKETFRGDNWTTIRDLVRRLFELYPSTHRKHSTSLNDYVRANIARCHRLISYWHWRRPELMLNAVFDFFGKNGLKQLRHEKSSGSVPFLDKLAIEQSLTIEQHENSFHIALKCLALGLQGMRDAYPEKKIRSFVFRTLPNHGRAYPKDQPLDEESLAALRNHHDLLSTLYWAAPPPCRPKLDHIRDLVNHESSHREACRLSVRAWANLTTFQLSTEEPYTAARPFALWHKDIMHQTLKQYRLAKTEADDYLKSGVLDGTTDVSAAMARQTMERNQEQVIATLRDCISGMRKAIQHVRDHSYLRAFLIDSDIMHLLELPHLEDRRLISVIRDTLMVLRDYGASQKASSKKEVSQQKSEESQDYGDFPEVDDFEDIEGDMPQSVARLSGFDFIQTPLWHLLSNAFGAENAPDDSLLMDCIDTWVRIAECQVASGERSWSYYLESFSQVSWKQLRQTEQTRKFGPYFMAALVECDSGAYEEHRDDFLQALLMSLVGRESMLRFQHRLLSAITRTDDDHPLMQNLPFFRKPETNELDITADTVQTRRLALISSILSNMRDDVQTTSRYAPARIAELKRGYKTMLNDFMMAMKYNYQQLQQGTTVTGAYVEFVQKIVQFLKQYTSDICAVLPFFTDSVAFPLPAGDPAYVVARLCGYAPKLSDSGTAKQLSYFIQTVAQQATDNQQDYLVNQLTTALCTDEAPTADRVALRSVLLQAIFPAYLEEAFLSRTAFIIAKPILQALPSILATMLFDLRVTQPESLAPILGSIMAVSHAFIRSTEQIKDDCNLLHQPHILAALSYMLDAMTSILAPLEYICSRLSHPTQPPRVISYIHDFILFVADLIHDRLPDSTPSYAADAHAPSSDDKQIPDLLAFCRRGLQASLKENWSEAQGKIWFGAGYARREVVVDLGSVEEERERVGNRMDLFLGGLGDVFGEMEWGVHNDDDRSDGGLADVVV